MALTALSPASARSAGEPPANQIEPPAPSGSTKLPGTEAIVQAHEEFVRREEEREAGLATPASRQEREASRHAYKHLSDEQAAALLKSTFGSVLGRLNSDPARYITDTRLDRPLGNGDAVVTSEGKTALMEGSVPVEAKNREGKLSKVDLGLEQTKEGFVAVNPLVEVDIGARANEGIEVGSGGMTVTQAGAGATSVGKPFGDKNAFFGEVEEGSDTDLLVSPISSGVEMSDLLRSADSPEKLRFRVAMPQGVHLRTVIGGGAEVVAEDGTPVAMVGKPTAVDAQGTEVPVAVEVQGNTVVLQVEHREGDYAYPILVDPTVENLYQDWGWWYSGQHLAGLSAWAWNSANSSSWMWPDYEDSSWPGWHGLFVYTASGTLPGNAWGQWSYSAPNAGTYLANATINPFYRNNHTNCPQSEYGQPYDYDGMWNETSWNRILYNQANDQGWSTLESWGRALIIGMGTSAGISIPCWRDIGIGGVGVWLEDWQYPYINSVTGAPTGWIRKDSTQRTLNVSAEDAGLGVRTVWLIAPGGKESSWNKPVCAGTYENRCPSSESGVITYETSQFPFEGETSMGVVVEDPTKKTWSEQIPVKLDGVPPKVILSGQLASITEESGTKEQPQGEGHDRLSLPVYNLTVAAEDGSASEPRSGVREIRLYLDGSKTPLRTKVASCSNSCPSSLTLEDQVVLTDLAEGEHTLEIEAVDGAGNVVSREDRTIEFEYIPATGMKEGYVLQHFVLPDGHDYAEEPEYSGPEIAVNVTNGNLVYHQRDLRVQAPSGDLEVERFYNSQMPSEKDSEWGRGWSLAQTPELTPEQGEASPEEATLVRTSAITDGVPLPSSEDVQTFSPKLHATIEKTPSGDYEVASTDSAEVSVFDASGKIEERQLAAKTGPLEEEAEPARSSPPAYSGAFGSFGSEDGQVSHPSDVAVAPNGHLWVTDEGNNRVEQFAENGEFLSKFGSSGSGEGELEHPAALAVDAGGHVWVADSGNGRVEEFDESGAFVRSIGSPGLGNGKFAAPGPEGIAVDAEGNVWVADTYGARLEKFTSTGEFLKAVGSEGSGAGELREPVAVAVGPDGKVWALDSTADKVVEFNAAGEYVRQFGSKGSEPGRLNAPDGITVDSKGEVWVADQGNARVQGFSPTGEPISSRSGAEEEDEERLQNPAGLAVDSKGNIWVANSSAPRVAGRAGPVASYAFDEGEGTIAHDDSGNGHEGTVEGAEWSEEGKFGSALQFNGQPEDCVTIPDGPELRLRGQFTLEAWIRPEGQGEDPVIFKEAGSFFGYALYYEGGHAEGALATGPYEAVDLQGAGTLPEGAWSDLALTYDGERMRLYVDGELVGSEEATGPVAGEGPLHIGCSKDWEEGFKGEIDNVRVYDRALSPGELGEDEGVGVHPKAPSDRIEKWSIPAYDPGSLPSEEPAAIDYSYSHGALSKMELVEPRKEANRAIEVSTEGGLVTEADVEAAETASYEYEGQQLTAAADPEGETKYGYDSAVRLNRIELPNGTLAGVAYDSYSRVTAVTVTPAGGEAKTTHFWYGEEPRETKVWGGGNPEVIYSIGEGGSVLKWHYKETPPVITSISGSLWGNRDSTTPVENKDQTLYVHAESPQEIASIQVIENGEAVLAEKTCEDNAEPPAHNCDQPEPLEWITNPTEHAAGELDLEVVATDFDNHSTAEKFFVTIPQQPPSSAEAPERPDFASIKQFREDNGLDREHPLTSQQMNALILELLYEWELGEATAVTAVDNWGVPMRAPELAEMEHRREYSDRDSEVIPEWAEEHAAGSYGGFYVDDRAGGIIYVGFTENQHALVESLKSDSALLNAGVVREFPTPPTTSVQTLEATAPSVTAAIQSNHSIEELTSSVHVAPEGDVIEVGATEPGPVREFLASRFGSEAPILVIPQERDLDGASRYGTTGPVVAGGGLIGENEESCTAGFGSRAQAGQLRGAPKYKYFVLTAGHCYGVGEEVGRQINKLSAKGIAIGPVRRTGYIGLTVTDGEGINIDPLLRSHSVLNGSPLVAEPIQGVEAPRPMKHVCWSGPYGGPQCGRILWPSEVRIDQHWKVVYLTRGITVQGDSGGPVWDRETHKAVGIITGPSKGAGGACWKTSYENVAREGIGCTRMIFTPLRAAGGSPGIAPTLGVEVLSQR